MGKIDIQSTFRERQFSGPSDPALLKAVYDPAFGAAGTIGVEVEFFVFERGRSASLGMAGSSLTPGDFMARLAAGAEADAELLRDPLSGYPCGLALPHGGRFCLENGGQVEYATPPLADLDAVAGDLAAALARCEQAAGSELGFLSHGTHPTLEARLDPLVPNSRYRIMERFFAPDSIHRWGNYTSSIQVNLDLPGGPAWAEASRLAFVLSRFAYHLFANSRYLHGAAAPSPARLGLVRQMDPQRRHVPPAAILSERFAEGYVEWALDASVMFVGDLPLEELPLRGELSFRRWLQEGYKGLFPGPESWLTHLGTLWPDVRPRRFLEVRAADMQPFSQIMAVVAFWQALVQDAEGREALGRYLVALPLGAESQEGAIAALLARHYDDLLFTEHARHVELLELAAATLERKGQVAWAKALREYAAFCEAKQEYWAAETPAEFVAKALTLAPSRELLEPSRV